MVQFVRQHLRPPLAAALESRRPTVYEDGEQSRDFTYVDNVVDANLSACTAEQVEGLVFNVGTGERHSLNELLRNLSEIVGNDLSPDYTNRRAGDLLHSLANIERARQLLGYQPRVRFAEGLRRTVTWFQDTRRLPGASAGPSIPRPL